MLAGLPLNNAGKWSYSTPPTYIDHNGHLRGFKTRSLPGLMPFSIAQPTRTLTTSKHKGVRYCVIDSRKIVQLS